MRSKNVSITLYRNMTVKPLQAKAEGIWDCSGGEALDMFLFGGANWGKKPLTVPKPRADIQIMTGDNLDNWLKVQRRNPVSCRKK